MKREAAAAAAAPEELSLQRPSAKKGPFLQRTLPFLTDTKWTVFVCMHAYLSVFVVSVFFIQLQNEIAGQK